MGRTMSERRQRARDIAAKAQANPEAFYKSALAFCTVVLKHHDPWGSADACVAAKVREAEGMPTLRVVLVVITELGRVALSDPINWYRRRGS
jgi:hypothetical protein